MPQIPSDSMLPWQRVNSEEQEKLFPVWHVMNVID